LLIAHPRLVAGERARDQRDAAARPVSVRNGRR
jgi:hypothetical protein